jgi:hypothetical protein
MKVALATMRDALAATEVSLRSERRQLDDAERRGRLAAQIPDPDTVLVAEQFAARHRERTAMLEKKLQLQQEELALADRDMEQLRTEYRKVRQGTEAGRTPAQEAAWGDIETAGGTRPETDVNDDLLRGQLERKQMDRAVDAQLEELKRKLGKEK